MFLPAQTFASCLSGLKDRANLAIVFHGTNVVARFGEDVPVDWQAWIHPRHKIARGISRFARRKVLRNTRKGIGSVDVEGWADEVRLRDGRFLDKTGDAIV
jgi:hypothetical protein